MKKDICWKWPSFRRRGDIILHFDLRFDFRGNKKLESQVWETMAPPGARSTPVMSELIILSRSELRLTRFLSSHKPTAPPGHINPVLHNKKGRINTFLWPHLLNNQIENVYKQKYVDVDQVIRCFFKSLWPVISSKVFFWWKENGLLDVFVLLISKNCWIRSACKTAQSPNIPFIFWICLFGLWAWTLDWDLDLGLSI